MASFHVTFEVITFCSCVSVKCFGNKEVITGVIRNQKEFDEGQEVSYEFFIQSHWEIRVRGNLYDRKGKIQHDPSINKLKNPIHNETRYWIDEIHGHHKVHFSVVKTWWG